MCTPFSSAKSDFISRSMACLPWKRSPDGLIHSPLSLQGGDGLGIAAVVGGNVGVNRRADGGLISSPSRSGRGLCRGPGGFRRQQRAAQLKCRGGDRPAKR